MINRVIIEGRLTKDPVLNYTPNQKAVVKFTLASPSGKTNDGKEEADFFKVVVWGKQAETVAKYKKKGDLVSVDGKLSTSSYEDKDGIMRYVVEIVANSYKGVNFISNAKKNNSNPSVETETEDNTNLDSNDFANIKQSFTNDDSFSTFNENSEFSFGGGNDFGKCNW